MTSARIKNAVIFETAPTLSLANATSNTLSYAAVTTPNPNVTYTGTSIWPFKYTTSYLSLELNGVITPGILQLACNWFVEPNITALDWGNTQALSNFNIGSWPLLVSMTGTNVLYLNASPAGTYPSLTTFSFPNVTNILTFAPTFSVLTTLALPSLVAVNNSFTPTCPLVTTLTLSSLTTVHTFQPVFAALATFSLPVLTACTAIFGPTLAACTSFSVPNLSFCGANVAISAASLTTLSLPALTTVTTTFAITAANLVTFSMNSGLLSVGGNFTMSGMKLDAASVNGILVSLAALDGTGGTTAYSSKTVNLSGGTSAAPSGAGATAKTTLQGRGCTVTTN